MPKYAIVFLLLMTALAKPVIANDILAAQLNAGDKHIECGAYYEAMAACIGSQDKETSQKYKTASTNSLAAAKIVFSNTGLNDAAFKAKEKIFAERIIGELNNNCVNVAAILDKYSDQCVELSQHPDRDLQKALNK